MDNSGENASGPASQPPTDAVSLPPDHVSLRVTYLVTGNPRPPHSLGVLPLTTTISTLKEKIQAELPEHPSPIEQRLIYQGRPLLQNDATLREVLRIEPGNSPGPLPYTLHIVVQIRSHTAATNDASNPAPSANPLPPPASNPDPSRTNHIGAVENTATRLQESLARLQHQIEANRADLLAVQHRIGMHHTHMGVPVNGAVHLPTIHAAGNGPALPMPVPMNFQNVRPHPPPVPAAWQTGHLGWHTRSPNNPNYNNHTPWTQQAPNLSGNPSNPSHPNPQMPQPSVQEYRGPNGEHVTVMTSQMTLPMTLSRPASAPGQPVSRGPAAAPQPSQTAHHPHALHHALSNPTATRPQPPPLPFSGFPTHLPMPFSQNRQFQPQPSTSNPTAWILSSPAGPQGFLFAPGHGYFSTTQSSVQPQSTTPQVAPTETSGPAPVAEPIQQQPQAQVDGADNGNADGALVRGNQGPAQPPLVQVQQNPEDNDLFGFLIQRGWLFLRLYLFMFVFSEPGTWKRWAMIIIAVIVCLQPRDGPFVRAMQAARRHLDNLIGPPAPQRQPDPAARGQPRPAENAIDQATHRPVNVRGAVQMTPEEAAARLLRENQERNRGFWRDIFYRIEQSIALFLASLVPGVGERHVMAREEARRETQRQEEERRRAAEDAAQQRATDESSNQVPENADQVAAGVGSEVKVDRPDEPSTSTSVQVRDANGEAGELRNRTT
ncbi:hypothetical protein LTR99_007618 [Exophiala xenobiotica]|uniref:Ubiquitin-like domain-containing protein n=1 Tax=Vermiconidia calcicola TaxID=1690605 RepID=A0AAV9Q6A6_9PEZI|nr:hypothetical protein LTR92_002379 [Exophiala xenobiotica]KAK5532723.1 hypothetical protein LTR23_009433 [Chaetothyriales sp. CCFEE 6169]KAK5534728.1 hypothetical protein LTR25_006760 [Vermiconidia calcicola]KAK5210467.1 hypothetical protein LTR41_004135 [Exophiala xenobiotica]KAK5268892.1 hypothetical protein LTR96_005676 [Exophiala xenobiotica]